MFENPAFKIIALAAFSLDIFCFVDSCKFADFFPLVLYQMDRKFRLLEFREMFRFFKCLRYCDQTTSIEMNENNSCTLGTKALEYLFFSTSLCAFNFKVCTNFNSGLRFIEKFQIQSKSSNQLMCSIFLTKLRRKPFRNLQIKQGEN